MRLLQNASQVYSGTFGGKKKKKAIQTSLEASKIKCDFSESAFFRTKVYPRLLDRLEAAPS